MRRTGRLERPAVPSRASKLAPVGKAAKRRAPALAAAYAEVDRRSGGMCEANVAGVCPDGPHRAHDRHHLNTRLTRPDRVTDPDAIVAICRTAHDWAGANPAKAREAGIMLHPWDDLPDGIRD